MISFLLSTEFVQGLFVYLAVVNWPRCDFQHPEVPYSLPVLDNVLPYQAKTFPGLLGAEFVSISGGAGALNGWHIPPKGNKTLEHLRAALYLHGNGCNRAGYHHLEKYRFLSSLGLHVYAFDYRGFGDSEGWPDENGVVEDAQTMLKFVQDQGFSTRETLLWGHSLGGAVAVALASILSTSPSPLPSQSAALGTRKLSPAVVLEATFKSIRDVAWEVYMPTEQILSFASLDQLLKHRFPSLDRVRNTTSPMLILHGKEDRTVPFAHGVALYDAAEQRIVCEDEETSLQVGDSECKDQSSIFTEFLSFDEVGHNTILEQESARESIQDALKRLEGNLARN